jgi:hypothetical protein
MPQEFDPKVVVPEDIQKMDDKPKTRKMIRVENRANYRHYYYLPFSMLNRVHEYMLALVAEGCPWENINVEIVEDEI